MPDQQQQTQDPNLTNNSQQTQVQSETPATWDEWLNAQPESVKGLYTSHVTGLKNTVNATRQERDELAKQVKELLPTVEKGSKAEAALQELSSKLEAAERKGVFLEEATKPEIGCRNPKAAYALAMADQLFDRRGAPDWAAIKAAAPELFGQPQVNANAGTGTGGKPPQSDMDTWIRRASGRG